MENRALEKPGARQMTALHWLPMGWVNFEKETGILDQGESGELPLTVKDAT